MSKVMKVLVGVPTKGNTVARQVKAVKKAGYIQGGIAAFSALNIASGVAFTSTIFSVISGIGLVAGNLNALGFYEEYKGLKPKYDEIAARAKQIFKKK